MPQDGHWLARFEVIPPLPPKLFSRGQKIENSPLKTVFLIQFSFENFGVFCLFGENFVTPLDSREDQGLPPD